MCEYHWGFVTIKDQDCLPHLCGGQERASGDSLRHRHALYHDHAHSHDHCQFVHAWHHHHAPC